jgi:glycosyltransferase involved in cell wall biosynthesis
MFKLAQDLFLKNVTFKDFVPLEELPNHINNADLCLGIFGTSDKAQRVIPHKILDYRACGKKVITERNPAILERFANDPDVILCEAGNAEDLAQKIINCVS